MRELIPSGTRRACLLCLLTCPALTGCPQLLEDNFNPVGLGPSGNAGTSATGNTAAAGDSSRGGSGVGNNGGVSHGGSHDGNDGGASSGGSDGGSDNGGSSSGGADDDDGVGDGGGSGGAAGMGGVSSLIGGGGAGGEGGRGSSGAGGSPPIADAGPPDLLDLTVLRDALAHRYEFEGKGTAVVDSAGGADGVFEGGTLDGSSGVAELSGSGQYVELPPGLISVFSSVTVEAWVIWTPSDPDTGWERIFDFGISDNGIPGRQGESATSFLFFTPSTGALDTRAMQVGFRGEDAGVVYLDTADAMMTGSVQHVAVVVDGAGDRMEIYANGSVVASRTVRNELSDVDDTNNWLGRSQWEEDGDFRGQILDFRIYGEALDAAAIELSYVAGSDAQL